MPEKERRDLSVLFGRNRSCSVFGCGNFLRRRVHQLEKIACKAQGKLGMGSVEKSGVIKPLQTAGDVLPALISSGSVSSMFVSKP
jgi:hypothetical protein